MTTQIEQGATHQPGLDDPQPAPAGYREGNLDGFKLSDELLHVLPLLKKGKLKLLLALLSRCNARNRCWPSIQQLATDTGLHHDTIVLNIHWFIEHGAIVLVPNTMRVRDEKLLSPFQVVYELTGVIRINGNTVPYLHNVQTGDAL